MQHLPKSIKQPVNYRPSPRAPREPVGEESGSRRLFDLAARDGATGVLKQPLLKQTVRAHVVLWTFL